MFYNALYGGVLIIWDKLFGTFEPEVTKGSDGSDISYGLVTNIQRFSPFYIQYGYIIDLVQRFKKGIDCPTYKFLFYGPGYDGTENGPRLGTHDDIPEPEKPTKYYVNENFETNRFLVMYTWMQVIDVFRLRSFAIVLNWDL